MERLEQRPMNQSSQDPTPHEETVLKLSGDAPARFPAVLLFGMPGVGKGTQGSLLHAMQDGKLIAGLIDRGELVPDEVAVDVWKHWLDGQISEGKYAPVNDVLILDGIPRRVRQCEILEQHIEVLSVVHLEAPSDEPIIERLRERAQAEGRADDADERIIRRRFEIYRDKTSPVLDYYPPEIVHSVNPLGTQMEIKKRILESIIPAIRQYEQAG